MKYKMIYQHDERDCGAASLGMILNYYGLRLPVARCREITHTDKNGTNIYGLIEGAEKAGLAAKGLTGSLDELLTGIREKQIALPFIAHVIKSNMQGHFIVITKITEKNVWLMDPAKGKRKLSLKEFAAQWTGNIVCFTKTESFKGGNYKKNPALKFGYLLRGQCVKLFSVFVLSLMLSFLGIMSAFLFQTIVDEFGVAVGYYSYEDEEECTDEACTDDTHEHNEENLFERIISFIYEEAHNYKIFFFGAIALYLMQGLIQFLRTVLMAKAARKIDLKVTMDYYFRLLHLPMSSISVRKTGEYLSRFTDAMIIRDTIARVSVTVFLDVLMAIACGILLYIQNSKMFIVAAGITFLHMLAVAIYHKPLEQINRELMESSAEVEAYIKETVDGIETLKVNNGENYFADRGRKKYLDVADKNLHEEVLAESQNVLSEMIETIGNVIIIWIGFELVLENVISIGSLLSFFIILGYFTSPIKNLIQLQPMIQSAVIAADRLCDIMELSPEAVGRGQQLKNNWEKVSFENVNLQYGNSENILKNINFSFERGNKIAIVGESGSGKTSLAKLLVRIHNPQSGKIMIGNQDICDISIEELRDKICYVKQDAYLFSGSIRDNLLLGDGEVSENELEKACKSSLANEFIGKLPYKYDSSLTEMAQNLSAGQKQRLLLTRAILRKPEILILDEATANLDWGMEGKVLENLFLDEELTVIMISHRLSSVKGCDKIMVLEKGTIAESGTHEQLIAHKGIYYNMWEKQ